MSYSRINVERRASNASCFQPRLLTQTFPRWSRYLIGLALISLIIFVGFSYRVLADGGALDMGFAGSGKTATDFAGATDDQAYALAIQADGRIVVSGSTQVPGSYNNKGALARYNSDGSLDTSFGNGGKVIATTGSNRGFGLAIQPDGKLLTTGFSGVTRYNADGSLDTTFGSGGASTWLLHSYAMALQPDGKILVGGYFSVSYRRTDFAIGRYNSDGSIDTTFGNGGKVTMDIASGHASIHALAVQPDGYIVGVGQADCCSNYWYAGVVRFDSKGDPDLNFGTNGKVKIQFTPGPNYFHTLGAVVVQPDGKLLVAGTHLARFNSNGSLDSGFGSGGHVNAGGSALALQPDGKFFLGFSSNNSFALARYNPNGSIDTDFGFDHTGKVITPIYGNSEGISSLALQPDGKIVAAGGAAKVNSGNGFYADYDFALARYHYKAGVNDRKR